MSEYAKKTVAELTELLKNRSLPHSGKKADLIARLEENDKATAAPEEATSEESAPPPAPVPAHDELPKVEEPPLKKIVQQENEASAPVTTIADEANAVDAGRSDVAKDGPGPDAQQAPAVNYTIGLAKSEVDEEMKKRQARAARFGVAAEEVDNEKEKALERAKRFGTDVSNNVGVKGLDEALPTERPRKRGRLNEDDNRQGGRERKSARSNDRKGRGGGGDKKGAVGAGAFSSEKDREAAEARKKRFAA